MESFEFCPFCGKVFFGATDVQTLVEALEDKDLDFIENIANNHGCTFAIMVPDTPDLALLYNHRIILCLVCISHGKIVQKEIQERVVFASVSLQGIQVPNKKFEKEEK